MVINDVNLHSLRCWISRNYNFENIENNTIAMRFKWIQLPSRHCTSSMVGPCLYIVNGVGAEVWLTNVLVTNKIPTFLMLNKSDLTTDLIIRFLLCPSVGTTNFSSGSISIQNYRWKVGGGHQPNSFALN